MAIDYSKPYPATRQRDCTLQYVSAYVSVGSINAVPVFTTALDRGRFFVTSITMHDPFPQGGSVSSTTLSFGSLSTSTTSLSPQIQLTNLSGSVNSQYVQYVPGVIGVQYQYNAGATTTVTSGVTYGSVTAAVVLGPGDCLIAFVGSAATTTATMAIDVCGYYV